MTNEHAATDIEIAIETEETFARGLTARAQRQRARGRVDMAREYEGLAAGHLGMASELRAIERASEERIAAIRAM